MEISEFDDSFFESLTKVIQSDDFQKRIRDINEAVFGRYETKILREEQQIIMYRSKRYFHEKRFDMEIFHSGDSFIVTANFSTAFDLLNLSYTEVSKKSGIYIIFNETDFYVGQTSDGFIRRFKSHYASTSDQKIPLFNQGKVVFFGRFGRTDEESGALGKDQLDYIEKELIHLLHTGSRTKRNSNFGNTSYISFENRIAANHLIDEMQRIVSISKRNVFIENELTENVKIGGMIDFHPVMLADSAFMRMHSLTIDEDSFLGKLIKERDKGKDELIFVEHEWTEEGIAQIPKVKEHLPHSFYLPSRDGEWPEDADLAFEFGDNLTVEFQLRSRLIEKLEELGFTDFSPNTRSDDLNETLKSKLSEKLLEALSSLNYEDLKIRNNDNEIEMTLGNLKIDTSIGNEGVIVLEIDQKRQHHFNLTDCLSAIKSILNSYET